MNSVRFYLYALIALAINLNEARAVPVIDIGHLPSAGTIQSTDQIPANRNGVTSRVNVGSLASQNSTNLMATGGAIDGVTIGGVSPSNGTFNNLTVNGSFVTGTGIFTAGGFNATGANAPSNGFYLQSLNTPTFSAGGSPALSMLPVTNSVNTVSLSGSVSGSNPIISAGGTLGDANRGLTIATRGTGNSNILFMDSGKLQASIGGLSNANSNLSLNGGNNAASISVQGGTNPNLTIFTTGAGAISFGTSNNTNTSLTLNDSKIVTLNGYNSVGNLSTDASGNIVSAQSALGKSSTTAIVSATTITPVNIVQHVSGTAAITTITPPTGMSATVGGCITLIADGAWTTTNAGNIFASMTAVAGTPYSACYDGNKFYIK